MSHSPFDLAEVKKELLRGVRRDIDSLFFDKKREILDMVKGLYEITTSAWDGSYHHGVIDGITPPTAKDWVKPEPYVEVVVEVDDGFKVKITVYSEMQDEGGGIHKLWYWLDEGTSFTQATTSPPIPAQNANKFTPGSLQPQLVVTWDSDFFVVQAGTEVEKPSMGWSQVIAEEVATKYPDWKMTWHKQS